MIGKFSIRTVPDMESEHVNRLVFKHVRAEFAKLQSKNTLELSLQHDGKWWVASPKHWNFTAAAKAVEHVWGVKPDLTREGGRSVTFHSFGVLRCYAGLYMDSFFANRLIEVEERHPLTISFPYLHPFHLAGRCCQDA